MIRFHALDGLYLSYWLIDKKTAGKAKQLSPMLPSQKKLAHAEDL